MFKKYFLTLTVLYCGFSFAEKSPEEYCENLSWEYSALKNLTYIDYSWNLILREIPVPTDLTANYTGIYMCEFNTIQKNPRTRRMQQKLIVSKLVLFKEKDSFMHHEEPVIFDVIPVEYIKDEVYNIEGYGVFYLLNYLW